MLPAVLLPASRRRLAAGRDEPDFLRPEAGQQPLPHPVRGGTPRFEAFKDEHEAAGAVRPFMQETGDPVQPRFISAQGPPIGRSRIQDVRQLRMGIHVQAASVGLVGGEMPEQRGFADSPGSVEMKDFPIG
jgi:hypothetical protein